MPREADYYSPGEAARMLGLAEFTVLGLLTSGQLEGQQDKQARWWIPATAVDEAVRRSRGIETSVHPSMEETIPIPLERHEPQASEDAVVSEDTTTSSAVPEDGEGRYTDTADTVLHLTSELGELRAKLEATAKTESALREERDQARAEASKLRSELEAERSKGFWRRLFGA